MLYWFEVAQRKEALLDVAMYERRCTNREMGELYDELRAEGPVEQRLAKWVEACHAEGDFFSDIYLLREATNSTR
jgi:hypothetical protein